MRSLLLSLLGALALLVALDLGVRRGLDPVLADRDVGLQREEIFERIIAGHFEALQRDTSVQLRRTSERWRALPMPKPVDELRIVLIGNSAALFSLVPEVIEERLEQAFPERKVRVLPLFVPGVMSAQEEILVQAALERDPDLIVLTPNLKGLRSSSLPIEDELRMAFSDESVADPRRALARSWRLYEARDEIRGLLLEPLSAWLVGPRASSLSQDFARIAEAAESGDFERLGFAYLRARLARLLDGPIFQHRVAPQSPIFGSIERMAEAIGSSDSQGLAVFMPINPFFRDPQRTPPTSKFWIDDRYVEGLATRVLAIFAKQGLATARCEDALPASGFIDLVHANGSGAAAFSEDFAALLIETLAATAAGKES